MTSITAFEFDSSELRTTAVNGKPLFVAADVCRILGIKNTTMALKALDPDEKGLNPIETPGGVQNLATVTESGLYALIVRSDKPNAKPFRKWVTSEVLPAIRETGRYELAAGPALSMVADPGIESRAIAARLDLSVIAAMSGIADPKWCESLARHTWAVYKGEKPDIAAEDRLLMVQPYLAERGVSKADIASIGSVFGKRLKAAYVAEYNREPEEVPALLNGRERPVKGYYERDRFLFDSVFEDHYAHLASPQQLELGAA